MFTLIAQRFALATIQRMKYLILIRGLPGSGKTTLAKLIARDAPHYEADQFFMVNGEYRYDAAAIKAAHVWCQRQTENALADGNSCIVSNTFTRRWEMEPYYAMAEKHGAAVVEAVCRGKWPNVHGVPDEVIAKMAARWEA